MSCVVHRPKSGFLSEILSCILERDWKLEQQILVWNYTQVNSTIGLIPCVDWEWDHSYFWLCLFCELYEMHRVSCSMFITSKVRTNTRCCIAYYITVCVVLTLILCMLAYCYTRGFTATDNWILTSCQKYHCLQQLVFTPIRLWLQCLHWYVYVVHVSSKSTVSTDLACI